MFLYSVNATEFSEHPVADLSGKDLHHFAIPFFKTNATQNHEFKITEYCTALLNKLYSIPHVQITPFLKYQCSLLNSPGKWLTDLENLLENNFHLFTTWQLRMKTEMMLVHIAIMHHDVEAGKTIRLKKYDITQVKKKLKEFKTFFEQLDFLYELKTEFLQDKFKIIDCSEIPFDQLITIEIEKIEQLKLSIEKIKSKKTLSKNNLSDQYIDNQEFILKMNISKRTAQFWRDKKLISYIQIGAKIYYKLSDVELMLQQNYRKPPNKR